jgi:hypothetical protein
MVDDFFELDCSALILVLFTKQGSQQFWKDFSFLS